ncbi:hypothetical protein [Rhodanobacter sp. DHG33]|uniref:hypothetical protein n=1 Tax=Rhodanobacter sp. DHG33 TaxID=2775921 RepID=UPI00177D4F90|nr:hypothetical protein [Rhodanobacter sp. DHG33]MBD8897662.1 hypothetical protein [Rhodanobacter sp. DHG33]
MGAVVKVKGDIRRAPNFGGALAKGLTAVLFVASACLPGLGGAYSRTVTSAQPGVGFFTPEGSHAELVSKTQFGMVNVHSPDELAANLRMAKGTPFKVNVDFGPVIARPSDKSIIKTTYRDLAGVLRTKAFAPLSQTKLRQFPVNDQLKTLLAPYFDVLKRYAPNVGIVFLADEPYLNGIPKSEMERVGVVARHELDVRGLKSVKLGVIFASGMFDSDFATMIDRQAGEYAKRIDDYYRTGQAPAQWVETMRTSRLSTYDSAGNMYTGGGIPKGFDVVGFDFYLSTMLLDGLHQDTLSWFAAHYPGAGCDRFANQTMTQIHSKLSFFDHRSMQPGTQDADRALLDAIYECRMQATTTMLQRDLPQGRPLQLLMISESSNNGVLEFYSDGSPKQKQPSLLVEARVLDEVHRAEKFFTAHRSSYTAGLMFFTYQNTYDKTISLNIGGASGMPSVMRSIFDFSAAAAPGHGSNPSDQTKGRNAGSAGIAY